MQKKNQKVDDSFDLQLHHAHRRVLFLERRKRMQSLRGGGMYSFGENFNNFHRKYIVIINKRVYEA